MDECTDEASLTSRISPLYRLVAREHFGPDKSTEWIEGWINGWLEGQMYAILDVLAFRGIEVPEEFRARVTGCFNHWRLALWLECAVEDPSTMCSP